MTDSAETRVVARTGEGLCTEIEAGGWLLCAGSLPGRWSSASL